MFILDLYPAPHLIGGKQPNNQVIEKNDIFQGGLSGVHFVEGHLVPLSLWMKLGVGSKWFLLRFLLKRDLSLFDVKVLALMWQCP